MTTRRQFLQTLAAIPPALALPRAWGAGADASRLALVIGNGAYRDSPLANPINDARAMAGLIGQAGFMVSTLQDAGRADMLAAIEHFGAAARRPETKQVIFYYAGHGAQLDWRNYLLPVDAEVSSAEEIKQRCVDLGMLLGELGAARDRTFIVILDACRNNPFGKAYQPQQKGLSQFDAPAGSLLAYATAPGQVAFDGSGRNGLYTENLLRELARRGTRIEDALKRVRLNVRLASHGVQIPWETTSLETDVYLFANGSKKLSDAELERQIEADLAAWSAIKSSQKTEDWVNYLRNFPNGRFAEIAQQRLARLLAETERPTTPAAPAPAPAASAPAIEFKAGEKAPQLLPPSPNPYSAGRYPLGRHYSAGDAATYRQSDLLTGIEERVYTLHVSRVSERADRVVINRGAVIWDLMGNALKIGEQEFDAPRQFAPAELQVGKRWTAAFVTTRKGAPESVHFDVQIVRRERISVPAGTFEAFRIEASGWSKTAGAQFEVTLWLVPGVNFPIKSESVMRARNGKLRNTERHELLALRQQVFAGN